MPGIVGLITKKPREQAASELLRMVEVMSHASAYRTGIWIDESVGAYVGWTVRVNSFSDGMPLHNETGDVVLVFSGEEFPEPGTGRQLKDRGHRFKAEGPSYLVHLYEEDPGFAADLNGMFHGLVTDLRRGTATVFNDRYGMHRVYYHESKDAFYFAAEAKAILEVRPELRSTDPRSFGEFVACGCVLENRTLFKGIELLPTAASWVFRWGSIERKGIYFQPRDWEDQAPLEPEAYYRALRDVFSRNLPRYFKGNERIGISLTGGLDTRAIMAWRKVPPCSLPCYTFGGMYRDCQDVNVARRVAAACRQPHEVISVGEKFLSRFPHYAERTVYLTDGCANVSRSPDLYANERVREIAPVRMTGLFGDEVLRHNRTFKAVQPEPGLIREELLPWIRKAQTTYTEALRVHPLSFSLYRQAPWNQYGSLALETTQVEMRTPFLDNDLVRTVFRAPKSACATDDYRLRLIRDGNPALGCIRTDRGLGGGGHFFGKVIHFSQEFTFKAEYAYDYGMPQWVARIDHLFSWLHLERLFLGRHKFYHFRTWYRGPLKEYVRQMLLDARTLSRPYVDRNALETMVRAHTKGVRNYTAEIHQVLTLELVHRLFLDSR
jgi:asparagine synthase (glutamine-hydrolysing)